MSDPNIETDLWLRPWWERILALLGFSEGEVYNVDDVTGRIEKAFNDVNIPIPMVLNCPGILPDRTVCGARHLDVGEFATKPHHTHACQACGNVWRPAVRYTVGVQFLPGFKNDGIVHP